VTPFSAVFRGAWDDTRYALRLSWRARTFSLVAVLSLSLGIGANLIVFGVADNLLLRPLAIDRPQSVVAVFASQPGGQYGPLSYPDFEDYRSQSRAFRSIAAFEVTDLAVGSGSDSRLVTALLVDGRYFPTLRLRPVRGRLPGADDGWGATSQVAAISESLWRNRFAASPNVIGRPIVVNGRALTVIGVVPQAFAPILGAAVDVYAPLALHAQLLPNEPPLADRDFAALNVLGRLDSASDISTARSSLALSARRLDAALPRQSGPRSVTVVPATLLPPGARKPVATVALLLLAVTVLLLSLACVNLANLLMARAAARRRELALRAALGASRIRIVGQIVIEGLVLSFLGAVAGLVFANLAGKALLSLLPPSPVPLVIDVAIHGHGLIAAAFLAVVAALAFSTIPAVRATNDNLVDALRDSTLGAGHGLTAARGRRRSVATQVALATVLLVTAGLFVRSLQKARSVNPGFRVGPMLLATIDAGPQFPDPARGRSFYRDLVDAVSATPGVRSVALVDRLPLDAGNQATTFVIDHGAEGAADYNVVSWSYFNTMGVPLVQGHTFSASQASAPEVVVNEALARRYFGVGQAIGKRISVHGPAGPFMEIVGIARDGKYRSLDEEPQPFIFLPFAANYQSAMTLAIRTTQAPLQVAPVVRAELARLNPNVPLYEVRTLREHMYVSLLPARTAGAMFSTLGVITLLLAALGIHGVIAFNTQLRKSEIGVRLALGAQPHDVVRLVVVQGMRPVALGLLAGLLVALAVTRTTTSLLYGIGSADPTTYGIVTGVIILTSFISCLVPARAASRRHPSSVLRSS